MTNYKPFVFCVLEIWNFLNKLPFIQEGLLIGIQVVQDEPRPLGHAVQGFIGHESGHAQEPLEELRQVVQLGTASGKNDALAHDVRDELRRGLVEDVLDGGCDVHQERLEGFRDLIRIHHDVLGQSGDEIPPPQLRLHFLLALHGGTDLDLHGFRGLFADGQGILLFDVIGEGLIELVAGHPHARPGYDVPQGDDRDLGCPAAHVDYHMPRPRVDGNARAQGREHRLAHHEHVPGARLGRGVHHRPPFGLGDARRNGNYHVRFHDIEPAHRLGYEIGDERLGDVIVGDDPVFERPVGDDILAGAADHLLGLRAHGHDRVLRLPERHDGRLVDYEALAGHENNGIRGTQVDTYLAREHRLNLKPKPVLSQKNGPADVLAGPLYILFFQVQRSDSMGCSLYLARF